VTDPILRLDPERLSVEPGGQVALTLTVTNPGTIVDGYTVDVVSTTPLPWAQVSPSTLSVYPQQEATAVITFAPPSGPGAPSGSLPFGVRVWSESPGGGSAVAEGDLDVGSVSGLQAKLTPIASTGRWSGKHTLKVSNWGNAPARLRIVPEDPAQALGFLASPEVLDIPLGGEVTSRIKVRTRHPVLRGSLQRLPFQIACEPDVPAGAGGPVPATSTTDRPVADGAFNQKPILTRMVVVVAGLVLLAGIGAAAWALTHSGESAGPDANTNPDRPTGFKALDNKSPENVQLVWDEMDGVDGFNVYYIDPVTEKRQAPQEVGDATTVNAALPPDTFMCFALAAQRGGLVGPLSEPECGETEPAATKDEPAPGAPSPSVTVTPPPAGGGDGGDGGGDGGGGDGDGKTGADPGAEPLDFLSVVGQGSPDATGVAVTRQKLDEYVAAGVRVKVLRTDDYGLARVSPVTSAPGSPTPSPLPPLVVVYVDGDSAAKSFGACQEANAAVLAAGGAPTPGLCTTFQVVSRPR
jgi:hypothetical protein